MDSRTQLLKPSEAAERLGVSVNTLESWRCRKTYPLRYVKVGSKVFYTERAIQAFLEERTVTPGEAKGRRRRTAA